MGKLGIMDLLSFAKAGYSPKDVRELLEMDVPEPINPKEIAPPEIPAAESAAKEPDAGKQEQDELPSDDIDYKKLYEEEKSKLEKIQQENTKKEISNISDHDDMKAVDDFLRGLM